MEGKGRVVVWCVCGFDLWWWGVCMTIYVLAPSPLSPPSCYTSYPPLHPNPNTHNPKHQSPPQLMKPVTWIPLIWGVVCGAAASGNYHWANPFNVRGVTLLYVDE